MSDAAILFTYRKSRTLADGSLRLEIDVEPKDAQAAFALFHEPGASGAIVRLTDEAAQRASNQDAVAAAPYGDHAKALRLSAFFRNPDVWRAVGTDTEFLDWLKTQACAARKHAGCAGQVVPAHVRRVANGAGTAHKPPYSAIALCDSHHRIQHQHGESALGGKEWFDRQRIEHLQRWCWESLKAQLGYEHWSDLPPIHLYEWAQLHDLERYLPSCYREGI